MDTAFMLSGFKAFHNPTAGWAEAMIPIEQQLVLLC